MHVALEEAALLALRLYENQRERRARTCTEAHLPTFCVLPAQQGCVKFWEPDSVHDHTGQGARLMLDHKGTFMERYVSAGTHTGW